jgi:hypothetical protein
MRSKLSDIFRWAETQGVIEVGKNPVAATFKPEYKVKRERLSLEQFWAIHAQASVWAKNAMMLGAGHGPAARGHREHEVCRLQGRLLACGAG